MTSVPEPDIQPDTKDWTWVLRASCAECGFDPAAVSFEGLADVLRGNAASWQSVLGRPDASVRPSPAVWSALEYGCHVRDVHLLFAERVRLMLEEDEPTFANWDQDETAVASDYGSQDPAVVAVQLVAAAEAVADLYASVPDDARGRRGLRSDGSEFTVETIGAYHLHDDVHHLHDVSATP